MSPGSEKLKPWCQPHKEVTSQSEISHCSDNTLFAKITVVSWRNRSHLALSRKEHQACRKELTDYSSEGVIRRERLSIQR